MFGLYWYWWWLPRPQPQVHTVIEVDFKRGVITSVTRY
jgi:hypothetical protein